MGRRLRYQPPEGSGLVEVTCRTIQGRFLLTPSSELNEIILGALGRAQELYPVGICAFAFASNHFHLLLRVESTYRLAQRGIAEIVDDIESQAALKRQLNELPAKGPEGILAQGPHEAPETLEEVTRTALPCGESEGSTRAL